MHWGWESILVIAILAYVFGAAIAWQLVYRFAAWRLGWRFTGGEVENQVLWGMTIAASGLPIAFCMKDWRDPLLVIIRAAVNG